MADVKVKCMICGREFRVIPPLHLKSHGKVINKILKFTYGEAMTPQPQPVGRADISAGGIYKEGEKQ